MNSSTGLPALTMIMTRRGFLSCATISWMRMRADDLRALGLVGEEMVHLLHGAVVGHDGEAVVVHVQNEVLAHDGQTDQCNVSFWFHKICLPIQKTARKYTGNPRRETIILAQPPKSAPV